MIPTIEHTIERMKLEVLAEMRAGRIPWDAPDFSALHDYIDANELGGFCEDAIFDALMLHFGGYAPYSDKHNDEGMPQGMMDYINACQDAISVWLANGGQFLDSLNCIKNGSPSSITEHKPMTMLTDPLNWPSVSTGGGCTGKAVTVFDYTLIATDNSGWHEPKTGDCVIGVFFTGGEQIGTTESIADALRLIADDMSAHN